ncbi:asparagine--tRNA ligase [Candidatus Heimdallarchaeota archaeon B3_Heim]|nr:MAG: asparagine--tRNA ligase [Candidatus Heimdallarchaeota archaeon B3_Heim]
MSFESIKTLSDKIGEQVSVRGWLHHVRRQGKLTFLVIRDNTGYIQSVVKPASGEAATTVASKLTRETAVTAQGVVKEDKRAPYSGLELQINNISAVIDYASPELEHEIRPDSGPQVLLNKRHLVLRGEQASDIMRFRDMMARSFRKFFFLREFVEVTPSTIVQTQVEGGSTLFSFKYFEQEAYLTQSSQLYLETLLPSLGNVFCVLPSFRAEKSRTRRHLTEYTHIEAEMPWFEFEDLLDFMEDMMIHVYLRAEESPIVSKLNQKVNIPEKPFERVSYEKAIDLLREFDIKGESGKFLEYGEDLTEGPERMLVDKIGKPTFLTHFPVGMKPFYMKLNESNPEVMNAADLLIPNVGEIIGASQREDDYDALLNRMKEEGLDPSPYYWYLDQRKYGTVPHSGFGLGLERFIQAVLNLDHIREACLYPRLINRATP